MAKISVYSPQITVPVVQAATVRASNTADVIAQQADKIYTAYDDKQKEDARVNVALERVNAMRDFQTKFTNDYNDGKITDAYPQEMMDTVDQRFTELDSKYADNKYTREAIALIHGDMQMEFFDKALNAAAAARRIQRKSSFDEAADTSEALAVIDPSKVDELHNNIALAATGITDPGDRAAADARVRSFPAAALQGRVMSGDLGTVNTVMAEIKSGKHAKIGEQATVALMNMAKAQQTSLWNDNYKKWAADFSVARANGKTVGLPDEALVGPDNLNEAIIRLNPAPTQESIKKEEDKKLFYARLQNGQPVAAPGEKGVLDIADEQFKTSIEASIKIPADATDAQRAKMMDQGIAQFGSVYIDQMRVMPDTARDFMARATRSKDSQMVIAAADLYRNATNVKEGLPVDPRLPQEDQAYLEEFISRQKRGEAPDKIVADLAQSAQTMAAMGKDVQKLHVETFDRTNNGAVKVGNGKTISYIVNFLKQKDLNPTEAGSITARVTVAARDIYVRNEGRVGVPAAVETAWKQVYGNYTKSMMNVNLNKGPEAGIVSPWVLSAMGYKNAPRDMRDPPDLKYGIKGVSQEDNAKWMQQQALDDMKAAGVPKVPDAWDGSVLIYPSVNGQTVKGRPGEPAYNLYKVTETGDIEVVRDPKNPGVPLLWLPHQASSTMAAEMAKAQRDKANTTREQMNREQQLHQSLKDAKGVR